MSGDSDHSGIALKDDSARLEALEHAQRAHQARQRSQSYLQTAAAAACEIWTHAGRSGSELDNAVASAELAREDGNKKALGAILDRSESLIRDDRQALARQAQAGRLICEFVTSVPFFMRGPAGALGSALTCALAAAKPHEDAAAQVLDGTLGAARGLLLNGAYSKAASLDLSMPVAGVALGVSSRALDTALSKESYINKETGSFSPAQASVLVASETLNPRAVLTDFVIFGSTRKLLAEANKFAAGGIQKSLVWTTAGTGMVTGLTAGALTELERQHKDREKLNVARIVERGGESALVSTLAAATGGLNNSLRYGRKLVALPVVRPFDVIDPYQFTLRTNDATVTSVFESSQASVPRILAERNKVELPSATLHYYSTGSGFVFSEEGRIATAYHVVANAGEIQVEFPGQKPRRAEIEWADRSSDLAVLKLEGSGEEAGPAPLKLDSSGKPPARYSDLYALGYPNGMEEIRVSPGIMRGPLPARKRYTLSAVFGESGTMWWSHMQVRPGNSGGPILNGRGEVVGVLSKGDRIAPHALMVPASRLAELDRLLSRGNTRSS